MRKQKHCPQQSPAERGSSRAGSCLLHRSDYADYAVLMNTNWYCVYTQRGKELWVARQFEKVCEEVYLPLLRQQRIIRRKLQGGSAPLFPRYLFARFCVRRQLWLVRHTPGVMNVVSRLDGQPLEVDARIITFLRQLRSEPGKEVRRSIGPFQKLRILFQRELDRMERINLLFEVLSS